MDALTIIALISAVSGFIAFFGAFIYFSKNSYLCVDNTQAFRVFHFLEALKKICPVGSTTQWRLLNSDVISPRCWSRTLPFSILKKNQQIYGTSTVVKHNSLAVINMIAESSNWAEWEPSFSHRNLVIKQYDDPILRGDHFMQSDKVTDTNNEDEHSSLVMYRFYHVMVNNLGWILFWNAKKLDWWFFLVQPLRECDFDRCLLTHIHGSNLISNERTLVLQLACRLKNIKNAVQLSNIDVPYCSWSRSHVASHKKTHCEQSQSISKGVSQSCAQQKQVKLKKSCFFTIPCHTMLKLVPYSNKACTTLQNLKGFALSVDDSKMVQNNKNTHVSKVSVPVDANVSQKAEKGLLKNNCQDEFSIDSLNAQATSLSNEATHNQEHIHYSTVVNTNIDIKSDTLLIPLLPFIEPNSTHPKKMNLQKNESELEAVQFKQVEEKIILNTRHKLKRRNSKELFDTVKYTNAVRRSTFFSPAIEKKLGIVSEMKSRCVSEIHLPSFHDSSVINEGFSSLQNLLKQEELPCQLEDHNHSKEEISDGEGDFSPSSVCSVQQPEACNPDASDFEILLPQMEISDERIADIITKGNYSASQLQAEIMQASCLSNLTSSGDQKLSIGGWMYYSTFKGINVFSKSSTTGSLRILSYLCQIDIPVKPADVWKIIRNPRSRFICDETAKKVRILEEISEDQKIIYTYHELIGLLKKETMDFCLLQTERQEHSKYYVAFQSIEYENCPLMDATIRGTLLPSGWAIEEVQGFPDKSKVTYLIQVLICSPDSMVIQELSNLVPLSVQNLKNYAMSKPM